jgi:hypothetical protein
MPDWYEMDTDRKLEWLKNEIARLDRRIDEMNVSLSRSMNRPLAKIQETIGNLVSRVDELEKQSK